MNGIHDEPGPGPGAPYAVLAGAYLALLGVLIRRTRRQPPKRASIADSVGVGVASYALARTLAEERVTVFLRTPFAEGPAAMRPKGEGMMRAVGELVTCANCLALWIATALSFSLRRFPRQTRLVVAAWSAYGIADLVSLARRAARSRAASDAV